MWTYKQSTGELLLNGQRIATGYSGDKAHKNNPDSEHMVNKGPIPRGKYHLGHTFDSTTGKGPVCIAIEPLHDQDLHGRGGFLIHGDSKTDPGGASHGCIILAKAVRQVITASPDRDLEVVR